jgi:hypothetical protein
MAILDTGWKRLKQMEIDGVKYDICVTQRGDAFRAAWVCGECCEQGSSAPWSTSPVQASQLAQVGLQHHHSMAHRYPRKPK